MFKKTSKLNSEIDTIIKEIQSLERNNLGMETAYDLNFPRLSLGVTAILLLSSYTAAQRKKNLYIYESYDNYFPYKLEIPGVEFWEGEKWVSKNNQ